MADHDGWDGASIYVPVRSAGVLQIGKTDSVGWLVSPPLPTAGKCALVVRACAQQLQNDHTLPVFLIRGAATNELARVDLTEALADYAVTLPAVAAGDRLAFKSFSVGSHRRVLLDGLALVSGYTAGAVVTNSVCSAETVAAAAPFRIVEGLQPETDYAFSVRAVTGGERSASSAVCTVRTAVSAAVDPDVWPGAAVAEATASSLALAWPPVVGAVRYRVSVWTNTVTGVSPGVCRWTESFSKAAATTGSPPALKDDAAFAALTDQPGWSIVSNVYPSVDAGSIRLGNTSRPGALLAPALAVPDGATLRVRVRRQTAEEGESLTVYRRSADGDEIPLGEPVSIGVESTVCCWPLPKLAEGERLLFRSVTGKSEFRTLLDEVAVLEGYSEGAVRPDFAVAGEEVSSNGWAVASLAPAVWQVAVEAVAAGGNVMAARTNAVDLLHLPPPPVTCVPLSALPRRRGVCVWREDFSALERVFSDDGSTAAWRNGATFGPWRAFVGEAPVETLTRNYGAKTTAGLYAYRSTNELVATYALGTMTGGSAGEIVYGLVFRNETPYAVETLSIRYDGVQCGFRNETAQALFCEYRVAPLWEDLADAGDWCTPAALTFETPATAASGLVNGADFLVRPACGADGCEVALPPGGYLLLRWRRPPAVKGAALAIDNVVVSFGFKAKGLTLVVR
jgi:hypothetical protein